MNNNRKILLALSATLALLLSGCGAENAPSSSQTFDSMVSTTEQQTTTAATVQTTTAAPSTTTSAVPQPTTTTSAAPQTTVTTAELNDEYQPADSLHNRCLYIDGACYTGMSSDSLFKLEQLDGVISFEYEYSDEAKQYVLDCLDDDNFVGYGEYYGGETDFDYDYTLVEYETLHRVYRVDDNAYLIVSPAYYGRNKPTLEQYKNKNITRYVISGYISPDLYTQWQTLYPNLAR